MYFEIQFEWNQACSTIEFQKTKAKNPPSLAGFPGFFWTNFLFLMPLFPT